MHGHLHAAGVALTNFNVAIDHHGFAGKTHRSHTNGIAELLKIAFKLGHLWIRVLVAHGPQKRSALAQNHADIFAPAKANPDNRRLAGETAFAESH